MCLLRNAEMFSLLHVIVDVKKLYYDECDHSKMDLTYVSLFLYIAIF